MPRSLAAAAAVAAGFLLALPAGAQSRSESQSESGQSDGAGGRVEVVFEALALPELLGIMHEEGLGYGADLQADLLLGRGGATWSAVVAAIYDPARMEAMVRERLAVELDPAAIAPILDFFGAETGRAIVAQEVAARRALLDEDAEAAAHDLWLTLEAENGPRWQLLTEFAETNDLVEMNVAGAMTANYAFYRGLAEGGAFGGDLAEDQILTDVWSREQEIREDTVDWVFSFTSLAYAALSDEELRAYVEFGASGAGQALNAALFAAFNDMFTTISRDLGRGAARVLAGQDI